MVSTARLLYAKINTRLVLWGIHENFPTKTLDKANLWKIFPLENNPLYGIERVHKQLFSRRLWLRVARVAIEKPRSDKFMKLDGDSKKKYLL